MGKGRKPDPPALRLLKGKAPKSGAAGPRKAPETAPEGALPHCPLPLDEDGRAEWERFGPILLADGRLTEATAPAFALWCDAWSRYQLASRDLRSNGLLYSSEGEKGLTLKANPAAGVLKDATATLLRLGTEFGLTPMARNKVGSSEAKADPLEAFLSEDAG